MQTIYFHKTRELKRTKLELEKKLNIKISIEGKKVTISGPSIDEYMASIVLDSINFGFSTNKALTLKDENMTFRILNIKNFTRKKNLKEVRARIIGKQGKTKKTIENISGAFIIIKENEVGLIADAEKMDEIITAITNLLRGTKQSNTYRYLEKLNKKNNIEYKKENW